MKSWKYTYEYKATSISWRDYLTVDDQMDESPSLDTAY